MRNALNSTFAKFAALAAITTAGCSSADVSMTTSSVDASSTFDSGKLGEISQGVSGDVSSVLPEVTSIDSAVDVKAKKCGTVTIDYNYPSTCITSDVDDNGNIIGSAYIHTIVRAKTGEMVSPLRMYASDGKGLDVTSGADGIEEVTCANDVTEIDARLKLIRKIGKQTTFTSFTDVKEGSVYTIGVESGKDCESQEPHFVFATPLGGGDGGEYEKTADGSLEKPYLLDVCDGKGLEVFPKGLKCK